MAPWPKPTPPTPEAYARNLALTRHLQAGIQKRQVESLIWEPGRWEDKMTPGGRLVPSQIMAKLKDPNKLGWPTPLDHDGKGNSGGWLKGKALPDVAQLVDEAEVLKRFPDAIWDAKARNWKVNGKPLQLNLELSRWLMGLPPEWSLCGRQAYHSLRNKKPTAAGVSASPAPSATLVAAIAKQAVQGGVEAGDQVTSSRTRYPLRHGTNAIVSVRRNPMTELTETEQAAQLTAHAHAIRLAAKKTLEGVVSMGKHLIAAKILCGHGKWGKWLETEFSWSDDTARRYMNVSTMVETRTVRNLESLPLRAVYLLASPNTPPEVKNPILDKIEQGEQPTPAELNQIMKPERPTISDELRARFESGAPVSFYEAGQCKKAGLHAPSRTDLPPGALAKTLHIEPAANPSQPAAAWSPPFEEQAILRCLLGLESEIASCQFPERLLRLLETNQFRRNILRDIANLLLDAANTIDGKKEEKVTKLIADKYDSKLN